MKHLTTSNFWTLYGELPIEVRELADKNDSLLKTNPRHPSLQLKRIEELWSVRISRRDRAIGIDAPRVFNGFGSEVTPTMTSTLPNQMLRRILGVRR